MENTTEGKPKLIDAENEKHHEITQDFKHATQAVWRFMQKTLNIKDGTDVDGTIEGIRRDISFRGHTAWILMFSIFTASIGLNVNSTAVVIGAMLISPLTGPILGIGLSVGINDWEMLLRSLKNFGIAIFISIITSTVYFLLTPLNVVQPELLSRTKPTFLDVLIAIFGGLAGIVAGSRREKSNVIPGVAIATALMPPLCTAGYGLATFNFKFFFGAFYLFFLNSVFISASTFVIVKYLHFPIKELIDPNRAKQIKRYMLIFVILVILPGAKIFWDVIQESRFMISAQRFVDENVDFENAEVINRKFTFTDTLSVIDVYVIGAEVPDKTIETLNKRLDNYGLNRKGNFFQTGALTVTNKTILKVHQAKDNTAAIVDSKLDFARADISEQVRKGLIEELFKKNEQIIETKNKQIDSLEGTISVLRESISIPFEQI